MTPRRIAGILLAAGSAERMGFDKLTTPLAGKTALLRSAEALVRGGVTFRFYRGLALEPEERKFWDSVSGWPPTKEVIDRRWREDDWTTEGSAYRRLPVLFA